MSRGITGRVAAAVVVALSPLLAATPVSATGPAAGLSATSLDFGAMPWLQSSPTQTLTVTNTGTTDLAISTIDIAGEPYAPEDFLSPLEGCFSRTLAPGATCQNQVYFRPQSGGPRSSSMLIYDNAPDSPQRVNLSGTGTGAVVMFTPRYIDFGTVPLGTTSAPRSFTAVNAGDGPVTIASVSLPSGARDFAITSDACTGTTLGPGQRCAVSASATPSAIGVSDGTLVDIFDNAGTGQQTYDGSFTGLNASGGGPKAGVSGGVPRLNQGVGTSAPFTLPIFNSGTQPLQITSISLDTTATGFAIVHDGCSGLTMPAGVPFTAPQTCPVDLTFAPPATGSFTSGLIFHDNELGGTHTETLSGTGFAPVGVASASVIDFGFPATGVTSPSQLVTLTNPSPQPLSVSGLTLGGSNPGVFSLSANTCTGTVAPGGSCTVAVAITPPFPYLFSATLTFNDNAGGSPPAGQTVNLRGEGAAPTFTVSTSKLDFGNVKASVVSATQSVTVTNTSTGAMTFGFLAGAGLSRPTGCSVSVQPGASCTVSVGVLSSALGPGFAGLGAQSALLKVFDPSLNQQAVEVDWTGTNGYVSIGGPLASGSIVQQVGSSVSSQAVISNSGLASVVFGQLSLDHSSPAAITADSCSNQTIAPGAYCTVTLTSTPASAGSWYTNLVVPSDVVATPFTPNPSTLFIRGLVGPTAQPAFFPSSASFPTQIVGDAEARQIVWLDNGTVAAGGAQPLTIASVSLGGSGAAAFRVVWDGCSGLSLDGAYSCAVEVGFDPTANGTFTASLLYGDDGVASPQAVSLSGTGLMPGAVASPSQLDFGAVGVNTRSATSTVTLTNQSNTTITVSRAVLGGPDKGDFLIVSETCQNQSVVAGGSCQVVLAFRPEAAGTRSAILTFTDSAVNSPQSVPLTGTGVAR